MSNTRIPSPARSHGAITPRRARPQFKKTRSVASPSLRSTPRLTNIIEDAFQLSPLPQRRSVLNDDTDIQEPLRKSWWKNLNENSLDMKELHDNMNALAANNIFEDIASEPSSPVKEFSIQIPDSSDDESLHSIATPQRRIIFTNKENTKQTDFNNITIVQQKRKLSSQNSDSDDSNVVPRKIFNYTKKQSVPTLPKELLNNLRKDCVNTSDSIEVPHKNARNLFQKEQKTKPKISDIAKNIISDADVEMHEISQPIFSFKRRSSVKLHVRSSVQSVVEEDWNDPLPSSTLIHNMSDDDMSPNQIRFREKSIQRSQNMSKDNVNTIDNRLGDKNDNNDEIVNDLNKSHLVNTSAEHNETLVNQSIEKDKSQLEKALDNQNETLVNKSICETERSLKAINVQNDIQTNKDISSSANIENEGAEASNKTFKDNTRVSGGTSEASVNNSGWDSHRTTRKTLRQTFGKDFTPRKSLRTLVMEKTAKRHTVGNFRSQDSKKTNISNIFHINTHNKTMPGRQLNISDKVDETPEDKSTINENQSDNGQDNFVRINHSAEQEPHKSDIENQSDVLEQIAELNTEDEEDNQIDEEQILNNGNDEAKDISDEIERTEINESEDKNNQLVEIEQGAENCNEDDNITDDEELEGVMDTNDVNQSNVEDQASDINEAEDDEQEEKIESRSCIPNQSHDEEPQVESVDENISEGEEQEEMIDSSSGMPNQSNDEEPPVEFDGDENVSGGDEQDEMMESTNASNEELHNTEIEEEDIESENGEVDRSEDDDPEMLQSDAGQCQSVSQEQTENDEDQSIVVDAGDDEPADTDDENVEEERLNHLHDNEDISRMPQANSTEYPVFESTQASPKTAKDQMREQIEKIRKENAERKKKLDSEVNDWRKNLKHQHSQTFFKVPQKPAVKRKPKEEKTKKVKPAERMFLNMLPPEFFDDIKYKPPKRFQPRNAAWANKHLYAFLEKKLEPRYNYKSRVYAEKLVEALYKFTQDIKRSDVAPEAAVTTLKQKMARYKVVDTHFDFYEFIIEFLPQDIRHKVVPSRVNLIQLPRPSVYSSIIVNDE